MPAASHAMKLACHTNRATMPLMRMLCHWSRCAMTKGVKNMKWPVKFITGTFMQSISFALGHEQLLFPPQACTFHPIVQLVLTLCAIFTCHQASCNCLHALTMLSAKGVLPHEAWIALRRRLPSWLWRQPPTACHPSAHASAAQGALASPPSLACWSITC